MTIPKDLKPGAIVSCNDIPSAMYQRMKANHIDRSYTFVVTGYCTNPAWGECGVLIEGYPNDYYADGSKDHGWHLRRFNLIRDGDGNDYQTKDDVDLANDYAKREQANADHVALYNHATWLETRAGQLEAPETEGRTRR